MSYVCEQKVKVPSLSVPGFRDVEGRCAHAAVAVFYWPGREGGVLACDDHYRMAKRTADAMGFNLPFLTVEEYEERQRMADGLRRLGAFGERVP